MKNKEAIQKKILEYINLIWGTRQVDRLDPIVKLMIDEVCNEVYQIYNKIDGLEAIILEKIARLITTAEYVSVRPSHTIAQINPNNKVSSISTDTALFLDEIPAGMFTKKIDTISFHAVTDVPLWNARLAYLFHDRKLYEMLNHTEKRLKAMTNKRIGYNYVWLGIEVGESVENLNGFSFYIDFPHLSEIHDYYDLLPYTICFIGGQEVSLKSGYMPNQNKEYIESDKMILNLYNEHYLVIDSNVNLRNKQLTVLPDEIKEYIDNEEISDMLPMLWIRLQFLPSFRPVDLDSIRIVINTFPVSNKKLVHIPIIKDSIQGTTTLSGNRYEKLLDVDAVLDQEGRHYFPEVKSYADIHGTYHLNTTNRIFQEEYHLTDVIERLRDVIQEEKVAFPEMNIDLLDKLMFAIETSESGTFARADKNKKEDNKIIGKINFVPLEDTTEITVKYWLTLAESLNGIPAGTAFTAHKNSPLHGLEATTITETQGGKEFRDIAELPSINKYMLTSKNKIFTDHDILSFCECELNNMIKTVEVELGDKVSLKPNEGLIRSIYIKLFPHPKFPDRIKKRGVLKRLKTQLYQRSPQHYNYTIHIIE